MPDDSDSCRPRGIIKAPDSSWLLIDIADDAGDWSRIAEVEGAIEDAARALASHTQFRKRSLSEVCVALSTDAAVQKLNATYRGKNKPTNVLSFPAPPSSIGSQPHQLGDIILALETVLDEAEDQKIDPVHHVQHLVIHGLLHLLGHDHTTDRDADAMEALEIEILATLGIANPYAETTPA
jgi:probable rRNA maturation factor